MLSVCFDEVWTLGVWGELACHKRLLTHCPSSQGWAPGVLPLCACMCMCVCVFGGLSSFLYLGGWFVCGGLAGKWRGGYSGFFIFILASKYCFV